ncbi:MAG: hypothetical protein NZ839_02735 [Endomicrobia bacterium]|nr:hypothetical protein [Endomicrobiia bacterium]
MKDLILLVKLRLKIFFNSIKFATKTERIRFIFLTIIGIFFFLSSYIISYQVVIYISTLPVIGSLFTIRILALAFLSSFIMLIFSSLMVTFSTMYDNEDIQFLLFLPLNPNIIFIYKFMFTFFHSCWMIVIILVPFVVAFAVVKNFILSGYFILMISIIAKIFIAVTTGVSTSILLSYLFPSKKLKNIVLVIIIIVSAIFYSFLRLGEPEKLLSPDRFQELVEYLDFMSKPVAQWLPSWWVSEIFRGFMIKDTSIIVENLLKLLFISFIMFVILFLFIRQLFYLSLFPNVKVKQNKYLKENDIYITKNIQPLFHTIAKKEIKLLLREPVQWVQLVIVVALTIIYVFNISKLPIEFKYVKITVSFLNIGGIMFILTAIVLRFIFVQPSLEYKMFWLIKSLPVKLRDIFITKFFVYLPIVILPGWIITGISNFVIKVDPKMSFTSMSIITISSLVIIIAGYSLGILFPKREYKDIL